MQRDSDLAKVLSLQCLHPYADRLQHEATHGFRQGHQRAKLLDRLSELDFLLGTPSQPVEEKLGYLLPRRDYFLPEDYVNSARMPLEEPAFHSAVTVVHTELADRLGGVANVADDSDLFKVSTAKVLSV